MTPSANCPRTDIIRAGIPAITEKGAADGVTTAPAVHPGNSCKNARNHSLASFFDFLNMVTAEHLESCESAEEMFTYGLYLRLG